MCAVVVVEVILWFLYHQGVPVDPNEFVKFTQRLEAHPMFMKWAALDFTNAGASSNVLVTFSPNLESAAVQW
jgi:hypothetical protein